MKSKESFLSYARDGDHMCMATLAKAANDCPAGSKGKEMGEIMLLSSMKAFKTSLDAFVRGLVVGRSQMDQVATSEDQIVDAMIAVFCGNCLEYWTEQSCCGHHALEELMAHMAFGNEALTMESVPVSHAPPGNPSLN